VIVAARPRIQQRRDRSAPSAFHDGIASNVARCRVSSRRRRDASGNGRFGDWCVLERMQRQGARGGDGRVGRGALMSNPTPPTTANRRHAGNASVSVGAAFFAGLMRPGALRPSASFPPFTTERESRSTRRQACERESCMFTLATCRCRFRAPACLPTHQGTVTSVMARWVFRELGAASAPPGAVTECSSYLGPERAGTQGDTAPVRVWLTSKVMSRCWCRGDPEYSWHRQCPFRGAAPEGRAVHRLGTGARSGWFRSTKHR
jgi:hypothetical protein